MLGKGGGEAANYGFINLIVPSDSTQRIQEVHLHLVHLLCQMIENRLFARRTIQEEAVEVPLQVVSQFKAGAISANAI